MSSLFNINRKLWKWETYISLLGSPRPHLRTGHGQSRFFSSHRTREASVGSKGVRPRAWIGVAGGLTTLAGVYYATHLERVPHSRRWRFMDAGLNFDSKLDRAVRELVLSEFQGSILPSNHMLTQHVYVVASKILAASNLGTLREIDASSGLDVDAANSEPRWTLIVVNAPKIINAMAGPRTIVVFTGMLRLCKDENGLAAVLSHEIGHVVARHMAERYSANKMFLGFISLVDYLASKSGNSSIEEGLGFLRLFTLPNERQQEEEADKIGLALMSEACFDPKGAPELLMRLDKLEKSIAAKHPFIGTHPRPEDRSKVLELLLPEAYARMSSNPDCSEMRQRVSGGKLIKVTDI